MQASIPSQFAVRISLTETKVSACITTGGLGGGLAFLSIAGREMDDWAKECAI